MSREHLVHADSGLAGLGWGLEVCISQKIPGGSPGCEPLDYTLNSEDLMAVRLGLWLLQIH